MSGLRIFTFPLLAAALLPLALAGQGAKSQQAPRANPPPRQQQQQPQPQRAQPQPKQDNHPGDELFLRLQQMTPEEREKALSRLPPARRAQIEQRIQNFEKQPLAVQERNLHRLERLNSLPPPRRKEVRQSMNQFRDLPDDRKRAINQALLRMSSMPDDERRAYMTTDDFRGRFSPDDQRMVGNLAEIE